MIKYYVVDAGGYPPFNWENPNGRILLQEAEVRIEVRLRTAMRVRDQIIFFYLEGEKSDAPNYLMV